MDPLFPTRSQGASEQPIRAGRSDLNRDHNSGVVRFGLGELRAHLVGLDPPGGRALTEAEQVSLRDPLAELFRSGKFPLTLSELLSDLEAELFRPSASTRRHVFAVAEAGQVPWSAASSGLPRGLRYVVALGRAAGGGAELLISSRPASDDPEAFLQVAAWDEALGAFQYYERLGRDWVWEGSSWHALSPPTRGRGPFDSHVNGALVMKELKLPWLHWHSSEQVLPLESFPPGHPVATDPLFATVESADVLERSVVKPGVRRWTKRRLDTVLGEAAGVVDPPALLRHLLTATTVNIVSSRQRSRGSDVELQLPLTFLFDADAIVERLEVDIRASPPATVRRDHYERSLAALGISLRDSRSGFAQAGDAFFAWAVPERSFEDQAVVAELLDRGVISAHFALAMLMVDVSNPLDSVAREALMAYVPTGPTAPAEIEPRIREAIVGAAADGVAAAVEAARLLDHDHADLKATASRKIDALLDAVRARAQTPSGVIDLMRLADARRRAFRKRRLAEFDLTLPFSAEVPASALAMGLDGKVAPRAGSARMNDGGMVRPQGGHMALQLFDPPGFVDDLDADGRTRWHAFISGRIDAAASGDTSDPFDHPRPQFFNAAKAEAPAGAATEDIKWTAFPRIIEVTSGSDRERWRRADASRDVQDEYCEWSARRDPATGKLLRVTFTCEGPEYWRFLAAVNPSRVLDLYREHVDPAVEKADLFGPAGDYQPRNRWNNSTTEGAMHLIQRNNTLGAEIEIAGAATILRLRADGQPMTDTRELIDCGRYGAPQRHSDPFIGARVNHHARTGALVTIANPVGIYFAGLDTQGWETPDEADAASFWHYSRGSADRPVRAVLEVPAGKAYTLSDVTIDGRPITFAAQVTDRIQMTIRALAAGAGQHAAQPLRGCVGDAATGMGAAMAAPGAPDVETTLASPRRSSRA